MISERDLAEKFSVIWKQSFPLLTANFIKAFNETQITNINKSAITPDEEIRYDIVSEIAFYLTRIVSEEDITVDKYIKANGLNILFSNACKSIWKREKTSEDSLTVAESNDIVNLSNNTLEFINKVKKQQVHFCPKFKGYGFISNLEGDLVIDDTLYEIKTVSRNFKSSDLKQLFIYLALQQVEKKSNWKYAGLYNPRRGTYCRFDIKKIIYDLTGGDTPNEAFENLLNQLIRDVDIDSIF
jgi:hypothetical protein